MLMLDTTRVSNTSVVSVAMKFKLDERSSSCNVRMLQCCNAMRFLFRYCCNGAGLKFVFCHKNRETSGSYVYFISFKKCLLYCIAICRVLSLKDL